MKFQKLKKGEKPSYAVWAVVDSKNFYCINHSMKWASKKFSYLDAIKIRDAQIKRENDLKQSNNK